MMPGSPMPQDAFLPDAVGLFREEGKGAGC